MLAVVVAAAFAQLSAEVKEALLLKHNALRAQEPASDMVKMVWDADTAALAQAWADKCTIGHSSRGERNGAGENLYMHSWALSRPGNDLTDGVQNWYDEKPAYPFGNGKFSSACNVGNYQTTRGEKHISMCGHYTLLSSRLS